MNAVASRNIRFISHCDQGGRGDGVQVMVHRGYAYIGHGFSNGITVVDVRDPKHPKTGQFHRLSEEHPRSPFADTRRPAAGGQRPERLDHADQREGLFLRLVGRGHEGQGVHHRLRVYDLSKPEAPREIAFMPTDGLGPHRIWYVGGRYAYLSVHFADFSDHVLAIVDMADPTKPHVVGKFWLPGMWSAGGEKPTWPQGKRYALHHALVAGNLAYSAWRDGGLAVIDVGDPTKPKLIRHHNWDPPFGGGTHSPLPLPDRNLLVVADEANFADCSKGFALRLDLRRARAV